MAVQLTKPGRRPRDPGFMLVYVHSGCMETFLVPKDSLGKVICCPYDGCAVRLPPPPLRESATLRTFTEADWLRESDLGILMEYALWWMSRRQQRLFAAACCRRAWHLFTDQRSREAVRAAEDYADGVIRLGLLSAAEAAAHAAVPPGRQTWRIAFALDPGSHAAAAARSVAALHIAPASVVGDIRRALIRSRGHHAGSDDPERLAQASLVREFLGNPFRPPVIHPSVLHWNHAVIPEHARDIYDARALPGGTLDNKRLARLADDLEQAGCEDAEVLAHLRSPGLHVRGCFAVDALLGRQ